MAAILNFRIFAKNGKTQISLTVRDRAILSKFSTHRVSHTCTLQFSKKISPPPKWRPFCIFEFLPKMEKTQICFYLLNRAR